MNFLVINKGEFFFFFFFFYFVFIYFIFLTLQIFVSEIDQFGVMFSIDKLEELDLEFESFNYEENNKINNIF